MDETLPGGKSHLEKGDIHSKIISFIFFANIL